MLRAVSKLIGYTLAGSDGEIGSVSRLFFEDDRWVIRHVVVDISGWLSGRRVLISPAAIDRIDDAERRVMVRLTKERIRTSPDIDTEKPVSRQHEIALNAHYGYSPYWVGTGLWGGGFQPYAVLPPPASAATSSSPNEFDVRAPGDPHLRSTKAIIGYQLQGADGAAGHIDDFVFDDESWAIRYLVIDASRFPGGRRILMPAEWVDGIDWSRREVSSHSHVNRIHDGPEYRPGELAIVEHHAGHHVYHVNEIIGKSVVTTTHGEKLGTVADALIDTDARRVIGIVIGHGVLASEHVLPLDDIERIGRDAVLVRSRDHLMNARDWHKSKQPATRCSAIRGRAVLTAEGRDVGHVSDLLVEARSGALSGIEVDERSAGGLRHRLHVVAAPSSARIGPDAVVIPS